MKPVTKLLSILAMALTAGLTSTAARAFDIDYEYPDQKLIDARSVEASHALVPLFHFPIPIETAPQISEVVHFDTASAALTPEAHKEVKRVATLLKTPAFAGKRIIVNGYTDATGKEPANKKLSWQRAKTVVNALVAEGVSADLLVARGFGESNPVTTNSTVDGRAANRRATFTVLCAPPFLAHEGSPTAPISPHHHHHHHKHFETKKPTATKPSTK